MLTPVPDLVQKGETAALAAVGVTGAPVKVMFIALGTFTTSPTFVALRLTGITGPRLRLFGTVIVALLKVSKYVAGIAGTSAVKLFTTPRVTDEPGTYAPPPKALPLDTEPPPTVTIRLAVPRTLVLARINAQLMQTYFF
ncbi:hypothetical protein [Rickettsia endosymbiont of Cantharis rufa]|uniref:hypothetical protein n=1 Tax=Rickettsia endosymbiont of Cantharis rufa TaxID=3066248 RepID=UPI003132CA12